MFNTLELATLAINCMSDGAVEVLADRGQEVAKGTAPRAAAKQAHSFGGGGIYLIIIGIEEGSKYGAYVGKSDKNVRQRMVGHDWEARADPYKLKKPSRVSQVRRTFPDSPVYKLVIAELPDRPALVGKLRRIGASAAQLRHLDKYSDFALNNTLSSLLEAVCVARMCSFQGAPYVKSWTTAFGRPPPSITGLNKDPATMGNYTAQLLVQRPRQKDSFETRENGETSIARHGDGRLVASQGKVTHITLKGKIAAEVAVKGSVSEFAEKYVEGESFADAILQAQIDHDVAGRAGGVPQCPVTRISDRWVLKMNKYRLPASLAASLGLRVDGGRWNVRMRFVEEQGFKAFPRWHGEGAEETHNIAIELLATPEDSEGGGPPSPWLRYQNESSNACRAWIELHQMAGKAFRKLKATTASALPTSPQTASTFASVASPSAVSGSSNPHTEMTTPAIASPSGSLVRPPEASSSSGDMQPQFSKTYLTALRELEAGQFVSAVHAIRGTDLMGVTFPQRRLAGEPCGNAGPITVKSQYAPTDLAEAAKEYSLWLHADTSRDAVLSYLMTVGPRYPAPATSRFMPIIIGCIRMDQAVLDRAALQGRSTEEVKQKLGQSDQTLPKAKRRRTNQEVVCRVLTLKQ